MIKDFKSDVAKLIQRTLKKRGYESFIGGSYRFGYQSENSDVDIFVGVPSDMYACSLISEMHNIFPKSSCSTDGYGGYGDCFILQLRIIDNFIHINFYRQPIYDKIKTEHALVEKFLNKNKILKQMRSVAISGSDFYRKILTIMCSKQYARSKIL